LSDARQERSKAEAFAGTEANGEREEWEKGRELEFSIERTRIKPAYEFLVFRLYIKYY